MKIKTLTLTMQSDETIKENAAKLRGFFATKFNNYVLLHQHNGNKFIYKYPLVQYKMSNDVPLILSIERGVDVLKSIYDKYHSVKLNGHTYEIIEKEIKLKDEEIGIQNGRLQYQFLTPWLALNKRNYAKYREFKSWTEKKRFLAKILVGNIISMSKGLGYTVPESIKATINSLREVKTSLKGTPMLGFLGIFSVNFNIPDYFGIGKSVSRGFGTVKRVKKYKGNIQ